ncbi:hypothetical protein Tco_0051946 [Tanacetum coccineum]
MPTPPPVAAAAAHHVTYNIFVDNCRNGERTKPRLNHYPLEFKGWECVCLISHYYHAFRKHGNRRLFLERLGFLGSAEIQKGGLKGVGPAKRDSLPMGFWGCFQQQEKLDTATRKVDLKALRSDRRWRNRTLLDMVRSMFNLTTLPLSFWDYALESAVRILNMDLGEAAYILGIKIYRDRSLRLIGLNQSAYIDKILKKFNMQNSKKGFIPMEDSIHYAVRCTRPDVAFAQNLVSRYQQNPGKLHWVAVKHILKYLRNTKDMFLVYGGNPDTENLMLQVSVMRPGNAELR